jgi:predicted dienelactone hydrolase
VEEDNPTTNYGTDTSMQVASAPGGNGRSLVRFAVPAPPADPNCSLRSVSLRLEPALSLGTRTLQAKRITSAWGELTATWNVQPASSPVDVASAPSGSTTVSFDVTAQVIAGATNGFLIRDSAESDFTVAAQVFSTREAGQKRPSLILTYD